MSQLTTKSKSTEKQTASARVKPAQKTPAVSHGLQMQPMLRIGSPNDIYEQEADRVAETVMLMSEPQEQNENKAAFLQSSQAVQNQETGEINSSDVPPIVHEVLRSPGQPLEPAVVGLPEHVQQEGVCERGFLQAIEPACRAMMAGVHVGLEQEKVAVGLERPKPGDPFGRLPVGNARVGQAGRHQNMRIVLRFDILVG